MSNPAVPQSPGPSPRPEQRTPIGVVSDPTVRILVPTAEPSAQ